MKSRAGFTLVELVGALAIISILVGMVLVTTGNSRGRALQTRISTDLEAINAAKGFWVLDHNGAAFPTDESGRFNAIRKYLEVNRSFSSLADYQPPGVSYSINGIGVRLHTHRNMNPKSRMRGFSLIEVVAVMALLLLIMGLGLWGLGGSRERQLREKVALDLTRIDSAKATWRADHPQAIFRPMSPRGLRPCATICAWASRMCQPLPLCSRTPIWLELLCTRSVRRRMRPALGISLPHNYLIVPQANGAP